MYIFDIIDLNGKTISINYTFSSLQMGEYFGYALVADDFDRDDYTDLAISAPFHSRGIDSFDNGAVYIYKNLDGNSFVLQSTLRPSYEFNGRFGTTLSKIGDINNDGFNGIYLLNFIKILSVTT